MRRDLVAAWTACLFIWALVFVAACNPMADAPPKADVVLCTLDCGETKVGVR